MTTHDWSVIDVPGVVDVIEQAAAKVAWQFDLDEDDLKQEAAILVSNRQHDLLPCAYGEGDLHLGTLQYRLEKDLVDKVKTDMRRRSLNESFEERYEATESEYGDYSSRPVTLSQRVEGTTYTEELVTVLLPAVWDEAYCYGVRAENAPDADMPRAATNKSTGNTLAAHIADIKAAWAGTQLTLKERRAVLLAYGMDWSVNEVAFNQEVTKQTASERIANGVRKLTNFLNGKPLGFELDELWAGVAA